MAADEAPVRAITVRQPWPWAMIELGKDIENRAWSTKYRGRLLIHAAARFTAREYRAAIGGINDHITPLAEPDWLGGLRHEIQGAPLAPKMSALPTGGIVAAADLVDVIPDGSDWSGGVRHPRADSPWYQGRCGLVLDNIVATPFVAAKGALGLWQPRRNAELWARIVDACSETPGPCWCSDHQPATREARP